MLNLIYLLMILYSPQIKHVSAPNLLCFAMKELDRALNRVLQQHCKTQLRLL